MLSSGSSFLWWDRDEGASGHALRPDVRESAHKVWRIACAQAKRELGDTCDAAELLESVVESVSRYLDRRNVPLYSADLSGLLVVSFQRSLRRLARRRGRVEAVGNSSDLAALVYAPDWSDQLDRRLFLEQLTRELARKSRGMLRLRLDGYDWREIGRMLGMTASTARAAFWRDVRKAQLRLLGNIKTGKSDREE